MSQNNNFIFLFLGKLIAIRPKPKASPLKKKNNVKGGPNRLFILLGFRIDGLVANGDLLLLMIDSTCHSFERTATTKP